MMNEVHSEQQHHKGALRKIGEITLLAFALGAILTVRDKFDDIVFAAQKSEETPSPMTLYIEAGDPAAKQNDQEKAFSYYTAAARLSLKEYKKGDPFYCLLHNELAGGHKVAVSRCMTTQELCQKIEKQLGNDVIRGCKLG